VSEDSLLRSSVRELVLEVIDGAKPKTNTGLVDSGLFSGENALYAIKDEEDNLWSLKYKRGVLPQPLKQKFTGFNQLKRYTDAYFLSRNLKIVNVKD